MSAKISSPSASTLKLKFIQGWLFLTKPARTLSPGQAKQAQILSSLILGSWLIFAMPVLAAVFLQTWFSLALAAEFALVALVIIFGSYLVSRTPYYQLSIWIYIFATLLSLSVSFWVERHVIYGSLFIFAPLINSFLGKWWQTIITAIISAIVFTILYIQIFGSFNEEFFLAVILIGAASAALAFASFLREYNRAELEKTTIELKQQIMAADDARREAERSDKVKSAFLASMSHELRTPLNSIINFTRFVADGDMGPVNEQQTELLTQVVGSSKHLLALINDVLDMSKIESGSLNLFIEDDVDIPATVNTGIATAQGLLLDKPIVLKTDIASDLPLIRGDKQRIFQILLNILSNACKFTWEGEINVRAYREKDEIIISVADTGPGIAPEDQEMVFEPFKQTKTGLRQAGGTGLGMPIAKNLAEAHHGRIWLTSNYGRGTTFYVALPVDFNG